jgi:hypothetical protein
VVLLALPRLVRTVLDNAVKVIELDDHEMRLTEIQDNSISSTYLKSKRGYEAGLSRSGLARK